jgi:Uma2 family endonuclease
VLDDEYGVVTLIPMGSAAERVPTFEELYQAIQALPPGLTGEILEPGVIRTMGRPGGGHRIAARGIARSLSGDDQWEGGSGWWFEQEAEIRFKGSRLAVPDLSGWRLAEGQPVPPSFTFTNPIIERPDWCCEVLSESTRKVDRETKLPLYAEAGVEWIWLVDPEVRRVEVVRAHSGRVETVDTFEGSVQRAIRPFSSVVDTSRWWVDAPQR